MSEFRFKRTDMLENTGNYSSRGTNLNDGRGNNCSQCIYNGNQRKCRVSDCNYNNKKTEDPDSYRTQTSVDKIRENSDYNNFY